MCWLCGSSFLLAPCTQHQKFCAAICLRLTGLQLLQNTGIFLKCASLVEHHFEPSNAVPSVWAPLRQALAACCNSYKSTSHSLSLHQDVEVFGFVLQNNTLSVTLPSCLNSRARCGVLSHSHSSWHASQCGKQSRACQLHHHRRITLHWQLPLRRQFSSLPGDLRRKCSGEGDLWKFLLVIPLHLHGLYAARTSLHRLSMCEVFLLVPVLRAELCSWYPSTCPWEKIQESTPCRSGSVFSRGFSGGPSKVSNLTPVCSRWRDRSSIVTTTGAMP